MKNFRLPYHKRRGRKNFIFFPALAFLLCWHAGFSQAPGFSRASSGGFVSFDEALCATGDGNGNIYTAGYFSGTVDFDPSGGIYNLKASGPSDIFIQKTDAGGNLKWAYKFGGNAVDHCNAMGLDNNGNIYIAGFFNGVAGFITGATSVTLTSSGMQDIFLAKLDTAGNLLFAKKIGGTGNETANALATDAGGNIIVTGSFSGQVNFDISGGNTVLTSSGWTDIFIAKYSPDNSLLWAKSEGSVAVDAANAVCTTISGNIYITGYFSGIADFNTGPGIYNVQSAGGIDMFIQKFDAAGKFIWAKTTGAGGADEGLGITADNLENAYVAGRFDSSVDFDPGAGTHNLVSNGYSDAFVQKISAAGNFLFAKSMGGTLSDAATAITISNRKDIFITGYFLGIANFDAGKNNNLVSAGLKDIFMERIDTAGNFLWDVNIGSTGNDKANSVSTSVNSKIITSGYFSNNVDFDYTSGTSNLTSNGSADFFVYQLDNCIAGGLWYKDEDLDGYFLDSVITCVPPSGNGWTMTRPVNGSGDCSDTNALINPGALEICGNFIDDNCNGQIDEICLHVHLSSGTINCNGGTTTLSATADNGTPPYQYSINGGAYKTSNTAIVSAGTHTVIVKDIANSFAYDTLILSEPSVISINYTKTTVSCYGGNDGSITINASGGTPPYQYSFDNGVSYQQDSVKGNLSAATGFILWVKDSHNCTQKRTGIVYMTQPLKVGMAGACYIIASKVLGVQASGGTPPYYFSIDGITYTSGNRRNGYANIWYSKPKGTYTVYIKDSKNCMFTSMLNTDTLPTCPAASPAPLAEAKQVNASQSQLSTKDFTFSVYPNPSRDRFTVIINQHNKDLVSIRVSDLAGRLVSLVTGKNNTFIFGENFVAGVYIAEIRCGNNSAWIKIIKQ